MKRIVLMVLMLMLVTGSLEAQTNVLTRGPVRSISKTAFWQYTTPDTMITSTYENLGIGSATLGDKQVCIWTLLPGEYMVIREFSVGNYTAAAGSLYFGVVLGDSAGATAGTTAMKWGTKSYKFVYINGGIANTYTSMSIPRDFVLGPGPLRIELLIVNKSSTVVFPIWYRAYLQIYKPY